jgi:general secretion pathway protein M
MSPTQSVNAYLVHYPRLSGLIYVALIFMCGLTIVYTLTDIVDGYRAHTASLDMLSQLEERNQSSSARGESKNSRLGSPFLEGQTVTVASAALLQRITSVITNAGGTVVSSEIVPQRTPSNNGYVTALANCELEQEALQKVLYDIEASLPFLFVDQLDVQTPIESGGKLRARLGVVGPWSGGK